MFDWVYNIVSTYLIGFNYCYLTSIILFKIDYLFAHSEMVTNIGIQHYLFNSKLLTVK